MFRMFHRSFICAAFSLSLAVSGAFAQSAAPAATAAAPAVDVRAACKADMDQLCPNVERGDARRSCIEANRDKFSQACNTARSAARDANQDRRAAFRAACAGDIAKLCATTEKGQGRTVDCVRSNADKLTPVCKTELTNLSAETRGVADQDATKKQ
jgi:Cysteine rich repeat